MNIVNHPSPNYNPGAVILPKFLVLHWTAGWFMPSVNWLCNPEAKVSAHYVISKDGMMIYKLVDHNRRAWHCNPSWHPWLDDLTANGLNSYSVGIEIEAPPSLFGQKGWDTGMMSTLAELCREIVKQTPSIEIITDHATIAPKAKNDITNGVGVDVFPWDDWYPNTGLRNGATKEIKQEVKIHYGMLP